MNPNTLFLPYENETVLVATSAGSDSMALLSLFYTQGIQVEACYVNHQQRPQEIEKEIACIEQFCRKRDIPFHVEKIVLTEQQTNNMQAFFREQRYKVLEACAKRRGIRYIATAHHLDDQVETQFMHFIKGYGLESFHGISVEIVKNDVTIIRPLLTITKQYLLDYCKKENIAYCTDSSNNTNTYFRNSIRNEIFPKLEQENKQLVDSLSSQFSEIIEMYQYVEQDIYIDALISNDRFQYAELQNAVVGKPIFLQKILVKKVISKLLGEQQNISKQMINDVLLFICDKEHERLGISRISTLVKKNGELLVEPNELSIHEVCEPLVYGVQIIGTYVIEVMVDKREKNTNEKMFFIPNVEIANLVMKNAKSRYELPIKKGKKKLSRLYIDAKFDKNTKSKALVLKQKNTNEIIYDFSTERLSQNTIDDQTNEITKSIYIYWKDNK